MRAIDASSFKAPAAEFDPGPAPMLQWVRVADLVVDETYQRPIYGAGRSNVGKIAAGFSWAKFAPLIVSPVAGGKFAVIDGQHRATAAALRGLDSLPAQVIIAGPTEQAEAFKAVNGTVTRMHALSLHRAAVAAGDAEALAIEEVLASGKASVAPYPKTPDRLEPGETLALVSVRECLKAYGRDVLVTALQCVTETENAKPGVLSSGVIKALCDVLARNPVWREGGGALLDAFDQIDIEIEAEEAKLMRRAKGVAGWEMLSGRFADALRATFKAAAA